MNLSLNILFDMSTSVELSDFIASFNASSLVRLASGMHRTGVNKFGALVGDHSRIGANAVVAPGALLSPATIVGRAELCDQEVLGKNQP